MKSEMLPWKQKVWTIDLSRHTVNDRKTVTPTDTRAIAADWSKWMISLCNPDTNLICDFADPFVQNRPFINFTTLIPQAEVCFSVASKQAIKRYHREY